MRRLFDGTSLKQLPDINLATFRDRETDLQPDEIRIGFSRDVALSILKNPL